MPDQVWYVRIRGKLMGPFGIEQMTALRHRRQLARFHEVSLDKINWLPASCVPGLFPDENAGHHDAHQRELVPDEHKESNDAYVPEAVIDMEPPNSGPVSDTRITSLVLAIAITASIAMLIGLFILVYV